MPLLVRAPHDTVRALMDIGVTRDEAVYVLTDERVRGYEIEQATEPLPQGARRLKAYREDER